MKKRSWRKLATCLVASALFIQPITALADSIHTVSEGESIFSISQYYGVTDSMIMEANGLTDPLIHAGMELIIPIPTEFISESSEDDSSESTTESTYEVTGSHIVAPGDTLSGIATVYGVTVDQLYAWNGLSSSFIRVGDIIAVSPEGISNVSSANHYYGEDYDVPAIDGSGYFITIQPGDTLSGLAWMHGTTVEAFKLANGLSSDWIIAGQTLQVPADALYPQPQTPVTTSSPSPGAAFVPSSTIPNAAASSTGGIEHRVEPGDTLSGIAVAYGVSMNDLYSWNPGITENLQVGQTVIIQPGGPVDHTQEMTIENDQGERRPLDLTLIPENVRPQTHVVTAGDNIWRIAEQYNTSADSIKMWNNLPEGNDELSIGDTLFVSNPAMVPDMHELAEGETLEEIASAEDITVENILKWNRKESAEQFNVGDIIFVSNPRPLTHNVIPGETLEEIATDYQVTVDDLRRWNYLPENSRIINGTLIVSDPKEDVISRTPDSTEEEDSESSSEEPSDES